MTNKEFIAELAQRTGYSPEDTQRMVNLLVETMGDRFQEDDAVLVPTFGTFEVKKKLGEPINGTADACASQIGAELQT